MSQSKNKLLTKLLNNATVKYITPGEDGFTEETHSETKRKGDSPLGEDKPVIYINSLKYKTPSQQQKMRGCARAWRPRRANAERTPCVTDWHRKTIADALGKLGSDVARGLTDD